MNIKEEIIDVNNNPSKIGSNNFIVKITSSGKWREEEKKGILIWGKWILKMEHIPNKPEFPTWNDSFNIVKGYLECFNRNKRFVFTDGSQMKDMVQPYSDMIKNILREYATNEDIKQIGLNKYD